MADITQDQFLQRYGNIMVHIWGMPALLERFKREPQTVLKEYGLDPGAAKVALLTPGTPNELGITDQTMESQFRLWTEGKQLGRDAL